MQERIGNASLWLTVILPFALGYFIAMAFRSINAILAHPLMQDLGLGNVEMGWITSVFLLTFALVQLPLGVLLDYWGPRKTQTLLFVAGAVGITLFGFASDVATLALGRGILGVGMAGGLMAAVKAVADWCHEQEITPMPAIQSAGHRDVLSAISSDLRLKTYCGPVPRGSPPTNSRSPSRSAARTNTR